MKSKNQQQYEKTNELRPHIPSFCSVYLVDGQEVLEYMNIVTSCYSFEDF